MENVFGENLKTLRIYTIHDINQIGILDKKKDTVTNASSFKSLTKQISKKIIML